MESKLGVTTFITWHPPKKDLTVGNIKLSNGNGVRITTKTTNSSGYSQRSTVSLEYGTLAQGELDMWVLFHAFILGDPWVLPSYMGTIHGAVESLDKPFGSERDYDDFLNTAYRTEGITQKMSYQELHKRFIGLSEQQSGMAKNWLLDLKPGDGWSHGEMADYSYWRMVIDFSIVEAKWDGSRFAKKLTSARYAIGQTFGTTRLMPKNGRRIGCWRLLATLRNQTST